MVIVADRDAEVRQKASLRIWWDWKTQGEVDKKGASCRLCTGACSNREGWLLGHEWSSGKNERRNAKGALYPF